MFQDFYKIDYLMQNLFMSHTNCLKKILYLHIAFYELSEGNFHSNEKTSIKDNKNIKDQKTLF